MSGVERARDRTPAELAQRDQELAGLYERLRAWAAGYLPYEAAVEFLIDTGTLRPRHPLVTEDPQVPGIAALWFEGDWEARIPYASGGERATWRIAHSMTRGVLAEEFGRLDRHRRLAFLGAMACVWAQS
jgi:hypothetical protein